MLIPQLLQYQLPPVVFDEYHNDGLTVLSQATELMGETERDGGIVYRIPGKGGEPARAKHKAILETGCLPERLPHTGQRLGEVYACPFSSQRTEKNAIHKFIGSEDNLHAIQKTHLMRDLSNSFVLQFHTNFDREYIKRFTNVKGSLPLSVRSLLVAAEDNFESMERKLREINAALKNRGKDPLIVALIGEEKVSSFLSHTRRRHTDGKPEKTRVKGDMVTVEGVPMGSQPKLIDAILTKLGLVSKGGIETAPVWSFSDSGKAAILAYKEQTKGEREHMKTRLNFGKGIALVTDRMNVFKREGPQVFGEDLADSHLLKALEEDYNGTKSKAYIYKADTFYYEALPKPKPNEEEPREGKSSLARNSQDAAQPKAAEKTTDNKKAKEPKETKTINSGVSGSQNTQPTT